MNTVFLNANTSRKNFQSELDPTFESWTAVGKEALERLKVLSGWCAFLASSAVGFVLPFGVVAVALLFGLWRSKAPIWAKLMAHLDDLDEGRALKNTLGMDTGKLGFGWALGLALAACGACGAEPAPSPEELCDWAATGEVPYWRLERVYDLPLRTQAADPHYFVGTLALFVDDGGISVFNTLGFIRANLDGEVVERVFDTEWGATETVVRTSEGYAGFMGGEPHLCLIDTSGRAIEKTCLSWSSKDGLEGLSWQSPNVSIVHYQNSQILQTLFDGTSGEVVEERVLLADASGWGLRHRLEAGMLLTRKMEVGESEDGCTLSQKESIWTSSDGTSPPFLHVLPEGYASGAHLGWVEGPRSSLLQYQAACYRGRENCSSSSTRPTVDVIAAYPKGSDIPTVRPQQGSHGGLGANQIWDGERFVGLSSSLSEGTFTMRFASEQGDIIGETTWPIVNGLKITPIGAMGFAAVAPGDYIITFSVPAPDNSDRIVRIKMHAPE